MTCGGLPFKEATLLPFQTLVLLIRISERPQHSKDLIAILLPRSIDWPLLNGLSRQKTSFCHSNFVSGLLVLAGMESKTPSRAKGVKVPRKY